MIPPLFIAAIVGGTGQVYVHQLSVTDISDTDFGGAYAAIHLQRAGTVNYDGIPAGASNDDWVQPRYSTIGDLYEVRCTVNSGDSPNDGLTAGVWYGLTTTRDFGLIQSGSGNLTGNWTIDIRRAGGATVATKTFNVSATGI